MRFGEYEVGPLLGSGSFGHVYRGAARPVAVKVLSPDPARQARFAREVRAIAAMRHPNIVAIHDAGVTDADAPYLVMPLASGTLADGLPPGADTRPVLLAVLRALAHAHARGVIHRDVKPGNVLRFDTGARWRLADFGIAFALQEPTHSVGLGTPGYIAPEQQQGEPDEIGPWSDLYSVGCLAWSLLSGLPARQHTATPMVLGDAHPALGWLAKLLAPDPRQRFAHAADAAWALEALPPLPAAPRQDAETTGEHTLTATAEEGEDAAAVTGPLPAPPVFPRPPVPARWPEPHTAARAGVPGLYRTRVRRLVGRADAQEMLWSQLRAVVEDDAHRVVAVRGTAGVGKSFLCRAFCAAAAEVGAATPVPIAFSDTPGDPLADTLCQQLRLRRSAGWLQGKLPQLGLEPLLQEALLRWLGDGIRPGARTRHRLLLRALAVHHDSRPLLLWLDDAQWAGSDLELVRAACGRQRPVLVVLAAQEEALVRQPEEAAQIAHLADTTLPLGPLPRHTWRELVRELLGLAGPLAAAVEARTAGNPLFAVQLVGDWVERGLLQRHPDGLRLPEGADVSLPPDLGAVWQSRIGELLSQQPDGAGIALELAALLGPSVEVARWQRACALAEVAIPDRLVESLAEQRLGEDDEMPARWRFTHGLLREAVIARADAAGRGPRLRRLAVKALPDAADAERRGLLLLAAGDDADALQPLIQGSVNRLHTVEFRQAQHLLELREQAMHRLAIPDGDVLWARGRVNQAIISAHQGDTARALAWLDAAAAPPDPGPAMPWSSTRAAISLQRAQILRRAGSGAEALAIMLAADAHIAASPPVRQAECLTIRAALHLQVGDLDRALQDAEHAARLTRVPLLQSECTRTRALIHLRRGERVRARALLEDMLAEFGPRLSPEGLALALNMLGMVAISDQDLDAADRAFAEAQRHLTFTESINAILPRLQRALIQVLRGTRLVEATQTLCDGLDEVHAVGWTDLEPAVRMVRLAARAGQDDWPACVEDFDWLRSPRAPTSPPQEGVVRALEQAARRALAQAVPLGPALSDYTAGLWEQLDQPEAAARLRADLRGAGRRP